MADIKRITTEVVMALTHEEFALVFRAIGSVAGAKVKFKQGEIVVLRELNVRLAKARERLAAQMLDVAGGAARQAEELMALPITEEDGDGS